MEWKANTKRKSREIKIERLRTGGGKKKLKDLTDLEQRLLTLISCVHLGSDELPDSLGGDHPDKTSLQATDDSASIIMELDSEQQTFLHPGDVDDQIFFTNENTEPIVDVVPTFAIISDSVPGSSFSNVEKVKEAKIGRQYNKEKPKHDERYSKQVSSVRSKFV